jgi:hypothetical protein
MVQSMSVAEYSRQFFDRVLKGAYGETLEENRRVAGDNFVCEHPASAHPTFSMLDSP